jgi:hypothetical protein
MENSKSCLTLKDEMERLRNNAVGESFIHMLSELRNVTEEDSEKR